MQRRAAGVNNNPGTVSGPRAAQHLSASHSAQVAESGNSKRNKDEQNDTTMRQLAINVRRSLAGWPVDSERRRRAGGGPAFRAVTLIRQTNHHEGTSDLLSPRRLLRLDLRLVQQKIFKRMYICFCI